jgi:hypothetical protein
MISTACPKSCPNKTARLSGQAPTMPWAGLTESWSMKLPNRSGSRAGTTCYGLTSRRNFCQISHRWISGILGHFPKLTLAKTFLNFSLHLGKIDLFYVHRVVHNNYSNNGRVKVIVVP